MDSTLRLLGIAYKAGRAAVGEEPVAAAARTRHARVILLAGDAADNSVRRAGHLAQAGEVQLAVTPFTKAELGRAVGRSACAMLAVTEPGLAHAVAQQLAAGDPQRYGPLADALAGPAQRALERQKEQRRHERNLRRRKAPWAPPPPEEKTPPPAKAERTAKGRTGAKSPPGGAARGNQAEPKGPRPARKADGKRKKTP